VECLGGSSGSESDPEPRDLDRDELETERVRMLGTGGGRVRGPEVLRDLLSVNKFGLNLFFPTGSLTFGPGLGLRCEQGLRGAVAFRF